MWSNWSGPSQKRCWTVLFLVEISRGCLKSESSCVERNETLGFPLGGDVEIGRGSDPLDSNIWPSCPGCLWTLARRLGCLNTFQKKIPWHGCPASLLVSSSVSPSCSLLFDSSLTQSPPSSLGVTGAIFPEVPSFNQLHSVKHIRIQSNHENSLRNKNDNSQLTRSWVQVQINSTIGAELAWICQQRKWWWGQPNILPKHSVRWLQGQQSWGKSEV